MSLPIQIKNLRGGQVLKLDVRPGDEVETLQVEIAEALGVQPESQKLVYRGKALAVGKRLEEYSIPEDSVVHLIIKVDVDSEQCQRVLEQRLQAASDKVLSRERARRRMEPRSFNELYADEKLERIVSNGFAELVAEEEVVL